MKLIIFAWNILLIRAGKSDWQIERTANWSEFIEPLTHTLQLFLLQFKRMKTIGIYLKVEMTNVVAFNYGVLRLLLGLYLILILQGVIELLKKSIECNSHEVLFKCVHCTQYSECSSSTIYWLDEYFKHFNLGSLAPRIDCILAMINICRYWRSLVNRIRPWLHKSAPGNQSKGAENTKTKIITKYDRAAQWKFLIIF